MFIRFRKRTVLEVCSYNPDLQVWCQGTSELFDEGEECEVMVLREKEDSLDIEIPGSGIVFDLAKSDVEALPIDVVEGSRILKDILPWPWRARTIADATSGAFRWEVAQKDRFEDGTILGAGECDTVVGGDVELDEPEARLIAKAPEMYVLLRQAHAGEPVMSEIGRLINDLEREMEKTRERGAS